MTEESEKTVVLVVDEGLSFAKMFREPKNN